MMYFPVDGRRNGEKRLIAVVVAVRLTSPVAVAVCVRKTSWRRYAAQSAVVLLRCVADSGYV